MRIKFPLIQPCGINERSWLSENQNNVYVSLDEGTFQPYTEEILADSSGISQNLSYVRPAQDRDVRYYRHLRMVNQSDL